MSNSIENEWNRHLSSITGLQLLKENLELQRYIEVLEERLSESTPVTPRTLEPRPAETAEPKPESSNETNCAQANLGPFNENVQQPSSNRPFIPNIQPQTGTRPLMRHSTQQQMSIRPFITNNLQQQADMPCNSLQQQVSGRSFMANNLQQVMGTRPFIPCYTQQTNGSRPFMSTGNGPYNPYMTFTPYQSQQSTGSRCMPNRQQTTNSRSFMPNHLQQPTGSEAYVPPMSNVLQEQLASMTNSVPRSIEDAAYMNMQQNMDALGYWVASAFNSPWIEHTSRPYNTAAQLAAAGYLPWTTNTATHANTANRSTHIWDAFDPNQSLNANFDAPVYYDGPAAYEMTSYSNRTDQTSGPSFNMIWPNRGPPSGAGTVPDHINQPNEDESDEQEVSTESSENSASDKPPESLSSTGNNFKAALPSRRTQKRRPTDSPEFMGLNRPNKAARPAILIRGAESTSETCDSVETTELAETGLQRPFTIYRAGTNISPNSATRAEGTAQNLRYGIEVMDDETSNRSVAEQDGRLLITIQDNCEQ